METTVGVVIPAHNAADFIVEALESVRAQTRPPDQVVVVDDGSTDQTSDVVEAWRKRTGVQITLLHSDKRGVSAARNLGFAHLVTDLIAMLDADDLWERNHLEKILRAMEIHSELVVCFGNHELFRESGPLGWSFLDRRLPAGMRRVRDDSGLWTITESPYRFLLEGSFVPPSTAVVRRVLPGHPPPAFDDRLHRVEDRDFFLRLSRIGRFGYFLERHGWYRIHDKNSSHPRNSLLGREQAILVLQKMLDSAEEMELTAEELDATRMAAHRALAGLLYEASTHGIRSYVRNLGRARSLSTPARLMKPRDLLRAVAFSVPGFKRLRASSGPE